MSDVGVPSVESEPKRRSRLADFFTRLVKEKPLGIACGIIILILIFVGIFGGVLAPYPHREIHMVDRLQAHQPSICWVPTSWGEIYSAALSSGLVFRYLSVWQ